MTVEKRVLVIDDEDSICLAFRQFFGRRGWQVHLTASGAEGVRLFQEHRPAVVFLDVRLPDGNGLDRLDEIKELDPQARVIVITAFGALPTVMRSVEGEAFEYLPKPVDLDRAHELAMRAFEAGTATDTETEAHGGEPETSFVGIAPVMQELYKRIAMLSRRDSSVLILGDTGTGKEMTARTIHQHSARSEKPFVAVNCGAIPLNLVESELFGFVKGAFTGADRDRPGRFEVADGGTLFLDEVGELPLQAQVKLLRVLDSRVIERVGSYRQVPLNVRIIAATNRNLEAEVREGRFRADLYYRLAVVRLTLPPLSERREDVIPLARHFLRELAEASRRPVLGRDAVAALEAYAWPGNVRELRNAVEHALAVAPADKIAVEDLPDTVRDGVPADLCPAGDCSAEAYVQTVAHEDGQLFQAAVEPVERAVLELALQRCNGNQSEAAAFLGLHRNTVRKKLRQYGIGG